MKIKQSLREPLITNPLCIAGAGLLALLAASVHAAQFTKNDTATMNLAADWKTNSVNGLPGANDTGLFDSTVTVNTALGLGGNLSIGGLAFANSLTGPINITNTTGTLTLGNAALGSASGIDMSSANQNVTIGCAVKFNDNLTLNVAAGRTLSFSTATTTNAPTLVSGKTNTIAGADNTANVVMNIVSGTAGPLLKITGGTVTASDGRNVKENVEIDGGVLNFAPSASRLSLSAANQTFSMAGGAVNIPSSTGYGFRFGGDNGANGSSVAVTGTQSGGILTVSKGGNNMSMTVGGTSAVVDSYTLSGTGILNLIGGGTDGSLGLGSDTAGSGTTTFTLSGGTLKVTGSTAGTGTTSTGIYGSQGASARQVFAWTGGTLICGAYNAANLQSTPGGAYGTLDNLGGTLSPGGPGVAGKTIIAGNYSVDTNSAVLAIDIGGTTQANAFTNGSGFYDVVAITGSAALGGNLNINLINGFTPAANNAFTVLTTTGINPGPVNFANNYNGYFVVSQSPLKYMQALVIGKNLVLTNYGVVPPALAASFNPTNGIGVAPFGVLFTDTSVGAITNRHWDFGDGNTLDTTATSVSHTYASIGNYTTVLTVRAPDGSSSSVTGIVHATAANVSLTWKGDGSANAWDTSALNWLNGATPSAYADPDAVTFDDSGSTTPNVSLNFIAQPISVTFNNSAKNYTIAGSGSIDANASVTLNGSGTVTLLTSNTYTGPTAINSGTLQLGNGATSGSIDNSSAITNNGALILNQPDNHSLNATITGSGSITKLGAGTLTLGADNSSSFGGTIAANGGTLAAATDNSLGAPSVPVTLNNATLQFNSGSAFTLNRGLTLNGASDGLNVNSTVILSSSPSGTAAVTLGGSGTLQLNGALLPGNVTLNGGSIAYNGSTQPGVIAGASASSSISDLGTTAGATNTLNFADGANTFGKIQNGSSGTLALTGSVNSINTLGGTAGLSYSGNSTLIIGGGTFIVTNANLVGSSANTSVGTLVLNGGTLYSSYVNGNNGGSRHFKGNLSINGGTFHITSGRLSMDDNSGNQTLTLTSGNLIGDNSSNTTNNGGAFWGFRFGNDAGNNQAGFNFTGIQTGGSLLCSNSGIILGGSTSGKTASYTLSGGTATCVGANAGLNIGADTNGTGSATFALNSPAKLNVLGTIAGGTPNNTAVQVFSFLSGTLAAGGVDARFLRDSAADAPGTFVNGGGLLLPGDSGYAGRLTITGNFSNAPGATLGIEIGGATAATAAQEAANTNRYDNVAVVGSNVVVNLDGNLSLSFINGFEPLVGASNQFAILAINNGTNLLGTPGLTGGFANVSGGRVALAGDPSRSFAVTVNSTNVVLSDYQTPSLQAYFSVSTNSGNAPLTVTFTDLSNGAGISNRAWNFGDGSPVLNTISTSVSHTYNAAGSNSVSLTVSSSGLGANTFTLSNAVVVASAPWTSPQVGHIGVSGSTLSLSGTGGTPGATFYVLSSTNVAASLGAWVPVYTNACAADGTFDASFSINRSLPQQFYILSNQP